MTDQPIHDQRILQHPEYARSYQHYLQQGATPEKAAKQAYDWTAQQFGNAAPPLAAVPLAQPAKKSKPVLIGAGIAVAAIVGLCGVGAAMSGGEKQADQPAASEAPPKLAASAPAQAKPASKPKGPGIGSAVRDGKFEFVVKGQKCGVARVGSEFLNQTAQGQYCLITMTIRNISDQPQTFSDSNQLGFNPAGAKYSSDTVASLYSNEGNQTFYAEINPGNQVTGTVVFDIPKGMKLGKLELHDSAFSGGVDVRL
jgi:hypothetical protein